MLMPSCKKVANEITGTWDVMTFDTRPEGTMQITFDGNSTAIRILNPDSGSMIVDSCTYEITKKNLKERMLYLNSYPYLLANTDKSLQAYHLSPSILIQDSHRKNLSSN